MGNKYFLYFTSQVTDINERKACILLYCYARNKASTSVLFRSVIL